MKNKKGRVRTSWRLDEMYIKVKGIWYYLYREVDKLGNELSKRILSGIEVVQTLRKNQMVGPSINIFKSFCKFA